MKRNKAVENTYIGLIGFVSCRHLPCSLATRDSSTGHYMRTLILQFKTPFVMGLFFIRRLANEAVTVFFVLSGYLVGGKLIEVGINGKLAVRNYCIDRSVRIYLPIIPAVVLT